METRLKAVLWDLDGVIVIIDSAACHFRALKEAGLVVAHLDELAPARLKSLLGL